MKKAHALYETEGWLTIASTLYSVIVIILLLRWRVVTHYRDLAERMTRFKILQALIVVPLFATTMCVLLLPPRLYGHHVSTVYGLSVQRWGSWFRDWAVQLSLLAAIGTGVAWILYLLIGRSPRRWWLYFWLAMVPISAFLTFISPVAIEPLFDQYRPLQQEHPQLVEALEQVIHRTGVVIPAGQMYEMIASAKTNGPNAYVTGFGSTKRVVVWDTAIRSFTTPQLVYVFGHELGHYVLGHILKGFLFGLAVFLVLSYLVYRLAHWMQHRWGELWGIRGLGDWASLPLLLLIILVLSFFSSPLVNGYSRHLEHQADQFGLEVTHGLLPDSPQVAAQSFQALGEQWLDYPDPSPLAVFWNWSHPPIRDRVDFALTYDPWDNGEAPEFVK